MANSCLTGFAIIATLLIVGLGAGLGYMLYLNFTDKSIALDLFLRTPEQQREVEARYLNISRTQKEPVRNSIYTTEPCVDRCPQTFFCRTGKREGDNQVFPKGSVSRRDVVENERLGRYKRQGSSEESVCCPSTVYWDSPSSMPNIVNQTVNLYHEDGRRQYFMFVSCRQATSCTDCTCIQTPELVTAVVRDSNDDVSLDLIVVPGCCTCEFNFS